MKSNLVKRQNKVFVNIDMKTGFPRGELTYEKIREARCLA